MHHERRLGIVQKGFEAYFGDGWITATGGVSLEVDALYEVLAGGWSKF